MVVQLWKEMYLIIHFQNIYYNYCESLTDDVNDKCEKYKNTEHFVGESQKLHHKFSIIEQI